MLQVSLLIHLAIIKQWILFIDSSDTLCRICSQKIRETASEVQGEEEIVQS